MNKLFISLLLLIFCIGCDSGADFFIDETQLQEGDLAFRGGTSVSSRIVEIADNNGIYSHVGIVVKYNGEWKIVHAVPGEENETGGIQVLKMDNPELFFASDRASTGCFARYDTTEIVRKEIADEAIRWWNKKLLFDNDYILSDTSKLYCTQLAQLSYESQGIDLAEGRCNKFPLAKEKVIFPSDFIKNNKVERYYILKEK